MPDLIVYKEIVEAVESQTFIKNGDVNCCEGLKYDFRLSNRILKATLKRPVDFSDQSDVAIQKELFIRPNEVAFVLTEETLALPQNMFCQLSTKRRLSHDGIVLLGGFTVDPNYNGKLLFGLYNISSQDYVLIPGRKIIAGIFYKIDDELTKYFTSTPQPLNDFPDELIKMIRNYNPVTTESFVSEIEDLKKTISDIRDSISSDKTWKEEFKAGLKQNNDQIKDLSLALKDITEKLGTEIDDRKKYDSKLEIRMSIIKGIGIGLSALLGGGLVSLIVLYVAKILKLN